MCKSIFPYDLSETELKRITELLKIMDVVNFNILHGVFGGRCDDTAVFTMIKMLMDFYEYVKGDYSEKLLYKIIENYKTEKENIDYDLGYDISEELSENRKNQIDALLKLPEKHEELESVFSNVS